jgi:hypothetical protein
MKTATGMSAAKLEAETDELKHKTLDKNMSKRIMQARMAKKMSQKDLATVKIVSPFIFFFGQIISSPPHIAAHIISSETSSFFFLFLFLMCLSFVNVMQGMCFGCKDHCGV